MIREEKAKLRKELLQKRLSLQADEKALFDKQIIENIVSLELYKNAECVIIYAATKGEIDLFPLFYKAKSDKKKVAFPRCFEERQMKFYEVSDLSELEKGKYGLLEPKITLPQREFKPTDLCIVPAIAYDKEGYRLGYGGGYYDVFLKYFVGTSFGAVYDFLLFDRLPRHRNDKNVNLIVTERKVLTP